jgi:hypothetical protein
LDLRKPQESRDTITQIPEYSQFFVFSSGYSRVRVQGHNRLETFFLNYLRFQLDVLGLGFKTFCFSKFLNILNNLEMYRLKTTAQY